MLRLIKSTVLLMFLFLFSLTYIGCDSDEQLLEKTQESLGDRLDDAAIDLYPEIKVKSHSKFGKIISIESEEILRSTIESISSDTLNLVDSQLEQLGFNSLRSVENKKEETIENQFFPDASFAKLLNSKGYIMVKNQLYRVSLDGSNFYEVDVEGKEINIQDNSLVARRSSDCDTGDYEKPVQTLKCSHSNQKRLRLIMQVNHWRNYLTSWETLTYKIYVKGRSCTMSNWQDATAKIDSYYKIRIKRNGVEQTIKGNNSHTGSVYSKRVASDWNLCIENFDIGYVLTYEGYRAHVSHNHYRD